MSPPNGLASPPSLRPAATASRWTTDLGRLIPPKRSAHATPPSVASRNLPPGRPATGHQGHLEPGPRNASPAPRRLPPLSSWSLVRGPAPGEGRRTRRLLSGHPTPARRPDLPRPPGRIRILPWRLAHRPQVDGDLRRRWSPISHPGRPDSGDDGVLRALPGRCAEAHSHGSHRPHRLGVLLPGIPALRADAFDGPDGRRRPGRALRPGTFRKARGRDAFDDLRRNSLRLARLEKPLLPLSVPSPLVCLQPGRRGGSGVIVPKVRETPARSRGGFKKAGRAPSSAQGRRGREPRAHPERHGVRG